MKEFAGKVAFLTGAGSGIGRQLALQLAARKCHLYLVDIDEAGLNAVAKTAREAGVQVITCRCDLSDAADIDRMLQHCESAFDVVDLVINNAGVAYYGPTHAMTQQQWDWLMNINLLAPILITQHFLPRLLERPDAHIVNMCSISGIVAGGRFAAYHTSKFGLIGFTEAVRAEYGRKGIGVTAICPGPVKTKLYDAAAGATADKKVPSPPGFLCTTPERVAAVTLRAMQKNRRQVLITPMAHGLFQLKRFFPGLIDFANQFSRGRRKRLAQLQQKEAQRLAQREAGENSDRRAA